MDPLTATPQQLRTIERWRWCDVPILDGRAIIYEPPMTGRDYVAGADFALGLEGRDFDAVVFLIDDDPPREVCLLYGHWGERMDRVMYPFLAWYGAFLLGERQVGLPTLRRLHDEYHWSYMWFERDFASRAKRRRDALGWPKTAHRARDPLLAQLRRDVMDRAIALRSQALIDQMSRLMFVRPDPDKYATDVELDIALEGGGSPDLVTAAQYANQALRERPMFDRWAPRPSEGRAAWTLGDILRHEELT